MRALYLDGGTCSVLRPSEHEEERVSLGVHLDAVARGEDPPDDAPMAGEDVGVALAEPLEQLGRALDVGEDEGDGPRRQLGHTTIVRPRG
jgi:hypothetical protein